MKSNNNLKNIFQNIVSVRKKGNLKCPDCNEFMDLYSCQDVIIDKCGSCNGIWFDDKEFGVFKRTLDSYDLSKIEVSFKSAEEESMVLSSCPRCKTLLNDTNYGYKSGVQFKKCGSCNGIWLPLHQTVSLIELAKVGQEIAPYVKGIAEGLKEQDKERKKSEALSRIGGQLNRRVPIWRVYMWRYFPTILPLYDDNPRTVFPITTIGIIFINLIIFILMSSSSTSIESIYKLYAMQPFEIVGLESLSTLFTSMFMHAGVFHLLGNMFFLWTFGDNVEESFGKFKYIALYTLFGLVASFSQIFYDPDSQIPTLGASGAISGILGAYLFLFPQVKIKTLVLGYIMDIPAWVYLGFWILIQLFSASFYNLNGGVAWWAHIGGFFAGLITTAVFDRYRSIKYRGEGA